MLSSWLLEQHASRFAASSSASSTKLDDPFTLSALHRSLASHLGVLTPTAVRQAESFLRQSKEGQRIAAAAGAHHHRDDDDEGSSSSRGATPAGQPLRRRDTTPQPSAPPNGSIAAAELTLENDRPKVVAMAGNEGGIDSRRRPHVTPDAIAGQRRAHREEEEEEGAAGVAMKDSMTSRKAQIKTPSGRWASTLRTPGSGASSSDPLIDSAHHHRIRPAAVAGGPPSRLDERRWERRREVAEQRERYYNNDDDDDAGEKELQKESIDEVAQPPQRWLEDGRNRSPRQLRSSASLSTTSSLHRGEGGGDRSKGGVGCDDDGGDDDFLELHGGRRGLSSPSPARMPAPGVASGGEQPSRGKLRMIGAAQEEDTWAANAEERPLSQTSVFLPLRNVAAPLPSHILSAGGTHRRGSEVVHNHNSDASPRSPSRDMDVLLSSRKTIDRYRYLAEGSREQNAASVGSIAAAETPAGLVSGDGRHRPLRTHPYLDGDAADAREVSPLMHHVSSPHITTTSGIHHHRRALPIDNDDVSGGGGGESGGVKREATTSPPRTTAMTLSATLDRAASSRSHQQPNRRVPSSAAGRCDKNQPPPSPTSSHHQPNNGRRYNMMVAAVNTGATPPPHHLAEGDAASALLLSASASAGRRTGGIAASSMGFRSSHARQLAMNVQHLLAATM